MVSRRLDAQVLKRSLTVLVERNARAGPAEPPSLTQKRERVPPTHIAPPDRISNQSPVPRWRVIIMSLVDHTALDFTGSTLVVQALIMVVVDPGLE